MSKKDKLINRFLTYPKDFTYNELITLLSYFGYYENNKGKTSGSRVTFINNCKHVIMLHKPHQKNHLKTYQIKLIIEELKKEGHLNE
jgi:hypothetical protein